MIVTLAIVAIAAGSSVGGVADATGAEDEDADRPWVSIVVVNPPAIVATVARVPGASAGVMSAGLGSISSIQTYLDISQGNRVFDHLYDEPITGLEVTAGGVPRDDWRRLRKRGRDAPAEIVPGLLGEQLRRAGIPVHAEFDAEWASLIGVDAAGEIEPVADERCSPRGCGEGLTIRRSNLGEVDQMVAALGPDDLLIALREPPALDGLLLPILIAGPGYSGSLASDTTRTDGFVLSTDIAPTVLEHLGIEPRPEITGAVIRGDGERSDEDLLDFTKRLADRPARGSVVLVPLAIWFALAALVALVLRRRGARIALPLLAVSCAWGPAMLLIGAALKPGAGPEALIFGLGAPFLAVVSLRLLSPFRALALACGCTVVAHAVDVVTGSPLTSLSVLGPNPAGGVRFFGIGNELEATLVVLTLVGTGALLADVGASRRLLIGSAFAAIAAAAAIAFAAGRFGADVGAAIVLAVGAAVAIALTLELPRKTIIALAIVLPIAGLAVLAISDLAFGGAHFVDSVLGVDSPGELADTIERRLRATVRSFTSPEYPVLVLLAAAVAIAGFVRRETILAWFGDRRPARDGFIAAVAAVAAGTFANDSGSTVATIGMIFLTTAAGLAWSTRPGAEERA